MSQQFQITYSILIPFIGTVLGAAMVFLIKDKINDNVQKALLGFASGVMVAASVWSLIMPAIDMTTMKHQWFPAAVGLALGFGFLLILDSLIPHLHPTSTKPEGMDSDLKKSTMLIFAVTLHNIPEGMAVGVVVAGYLSGITSISIASVMVLATGIALQNFPEGAIVSMPIAQRIGKWKSFVYGALSGIVEPIAALIAIGLTSLVEPILPYVLAFAAGAMLYVVVEELIPDAQTGPHSNATTIGFAVGFILMMVLDVALG